MLKAFMLVFIFKIPVRPIIWLMNKLMCQIIKLIFWQIINFPYSVLVFCQFPLPINSQWTDGNPDIKVVPELLSLALLARIGVIGIACRTKMLKVHFFVCFVGYAVERKVITVQSSRMLDILQEGWTIFKKDWNSSTWMEHLQEGLKICQHNFKVFKEWEFLNRRMGNYEIKKKLHF